MWHWKSFSAGTVGQTAHLKCHPSTPWSDPSTFSAVRHHPYCQRQRRCNHWMYRTFKFNIMFLALDFSARGSSYTHCCRALPLALANLLVASQVWEILRNVPKIGTYSSCQRYRDIASYWQKVAQFSHAPVYLRPIRPDAAIPSKFRSVVKSQKTTMMGWRISTVFSLPFWYITGLSRTDGFAAPISRVRCIH